MNKKALESLISKEVSVSLIEDTDIQELTLSTSRYFTTDLDISDSNATNQELNQFYLFIEKEKKVLKAEITKVIAESLERISKKQNEILGD